MIENDSNGGPALATRSGPTLRFGNVVMNKIVQQITLAEWDQRYVVCRRRGL